MNELNEWYRSYSETNKMVEGVHETVKMGFEQVNEKIDRLEGVFL